MENKENLQKIQAALNKMILPEERDGGLSAELAGVVLGLAAISRHNAEVIAADLDGKSDVLKELSKKSVGPCQAAQKGQRLQHGRKRSAEACGRVFCRAG